MKTWAILHQRTPQVGGWECTITFTVMTARQFTDETHAVSGHARWRWLAHWRAMRAAKRLMREIGALPTFAVRAARQKNGWAISALIAVLFAVPNAEATPCRHQVVVQKQVVAAEVVYPVVQQIVVPVYGLIPYYQPYVAPAAVQQQAVVTEQDVLKELISVIKDLRADVQSLKAGPARQEAAPKLTEAEIKTIAIMRKNCAQCHNQASAELDGGNLVLFQQNGEFAGVKPDVAKRIVRRVGTGSMPPQTGPKLDDADRKHILDAFKH